MTLSIPIIDIADYLAGSAAARDEVAAQLRDALTTVGFFVLTGHGVAPERISRTFDAAARFHDLPMEKKLALKLNEHNNGYMSIARYTVKTSDINDNDKADLNESFFVRRERPADDPVYLSGERFVGPNQWPDESELTGFRADVLAYIDAMESLMHRFLPAVAVSLDLDPDWFAAPFDDAYFSLRLLHYPPVEAEDNQFGIAPHNDSCFMTFLSLTDVPGLQIRTTNGEWLDIPYVPNGITVNSGDILHRWTNGRFLSTPHRVVPPNGAERYAMPFFFGPSWDATVECLPTCTGPDDPPKWPPITYRDWMTYWYDANYDASEQESAVA